VALGRPTTGELVVFKPKSHKKAGPFLRTSRLFCSETGNSLPFPSRAIARLEIRK